jgi:cob(I)alamin adenosyltransferase
MPSDQPKDVPEKTAACTVDELIAQYQQGIVQVYTGDGKGKTTAAFGQALRALGRGRRVHVLQFMKGRKYGECLAAEQYLPQLTIELVGLDSFVMRDNPAPADIALAKHGLARAREIIASGACDMLILDEINVALDFRLIPLEDVLDLIRNKPPALDLVLTGRYAPPEIIALADLVSEVKEIKHHYKAGIKERAGIEY